MLSIKFSGVNLIFKILFQYYHGYNMRRVISNLLDPKICEDSDDERYDGHCTSYLTDDA